MPLERLNGLELQATSDFHVHLRDGTMMETVAPTIRQGGVNLVFVMPNLVPPVETVEQALAYHQRLQAVNTGSVRYLMSLYLTTNTTPEMIIEAKKQGIIGVKVYPAGVTTNSSAGVTSYEQFYPIFAEMERQDMILNLHGECPNSATVTELNAEAEFLPTLASLHNQFPRLCIILEHCTTAAAVAAVEACGPTVAGTITAHHLFLTQPDWQADPFCYCKPVAKTMEDRAALLRAATSPRSRFFLGTDSAPHPREKKQANKPAAGVFTQPYATQLVLEAFERAVEEKIVTEEQVSADVVAQFLGKRGRAFYREEAHSMEHIVLRRKDSIVQESVTSSDGTIQVVNFRAAQTLRWDVEWKSD